MFNAKDVSFDGAEELDKTGEVGAAQDKAILGILGVTYRNGSATVAFTSQWIGASELSNDPNNAFFGAAISDRFFHNLPFRYQVFEGIRLLVGANNITDNLVGIEQSGPDVPTG